MQFLYGGLLRLLIHHFGQAILIMLIKPHVLLLDQTREPAQYFLQPLIDDSRPSLEDCHHTSWSLGDPLGGWCSTDRILRKALGRHFPAAQMNPRQLVST